MTAVCGSDGQWTPNPGGVTCRPKLTQTFTRLFIQVSILTPGSTPTGPGKMVLLSACIKHIAWAEAKCNYYSRQFLKEMGHLYNTKGAVHFVPLLCYFACFHANVCCCILKSVRRYTCIPTTAYPPLLYIAQRPQMQPWVVPVVVVFVSVLVLSCVVIIIVVGIVIVRRRQSISMLGLFSWWTFVNVIIITIFVCRVSLKESDCKVRHC